MDSRSSRDAHDPVVCADVLGAFGVSSDEVRDETDTTDSADSLETTIEESLAGAEHPTEFVRRTVVGASRGIDAPARYWSHAPQVQFDAVFEAIGWSAELTDARGRPLDAPGDAPEPWTVAVTDANGITRQMDFSYPDTDLDDYNYPALVHAVNARLLYGLECEFVQLSDGTDRWRFALVETDELDRIRDSYGLRVEVFDRPLLSAVQPPAYDPNEDADDEIPLPDWVSPRRSGSRFSAGQTETSDRWDVDGFTDDIAAVRPDPDSVLADDDSAEPFIDFVDTGDGESGVSTDSADEGAESATTDEATAVDSTASADSSASFFDDTSGWSFEPRGSSGVDDGGSAGTTDASIAPTGTSAASGASTATGSTNTLATSVDSGSSSSSSGSSSPSTDTGGFELAGGSPAVSRSSSDDDALDDLFDDMADDAATESAGRTDPEYDGFDAGDLEAFKRGARESRVENEHFGVGVRPESEDDRLAAYGAALDAGGRLTVGGLLDDDTFVPTFPAAETDEVRISYEDKCELDAPPPVERTEGDDGFVWVNSGGLSEKRL
ncbi:hypothetical protein [Haloarchaeobius sp. DFWS5]|uniref:hypothetical protein n=1 Tax=Haloarchaeobius sp. DFWS5 TaxID=3446114 RepID=UPI003EC0EEF5